MGADLGDVEKRKCCDCMYLIYLMTPYHLYVIALNKRVFFNNIRRKCAESGLLFHFNASVYA
jgi:hypothetical protein